MNDRRSKIIERSQVEQQHKADRREIKAFHSARGKRPYWKTKREWRGETIAEFLIQL